MAARGEPPAEDGGRAENAGPPDGDAPAAAAPRAETAAQGSGGRQEGGGQPQASGNRDGGERNDSRGNGAGGSGSVTVTGSDAASASAGSADRLTRLLRLEGRKERVAVATAITAALALVAALLATDGLGAETETITLVTGEDVTGAGLYQQLVDEWNATREDGEVRAELIEISGGADLVRAELLRWSRTDGFSYDILNIDNQWTAEFASNGWIEPLPDAAGMDGVLAPSAEAVTYDGTRWAKPFIADVGLLYYRADLLEEEELVGGWADALALLSETARAEDVDYGYSAQFAPYEGLTVNALEITYGMRGSGGDDEPPVEFSGGSGRAAVDLMAGALADGTVHPGVLADGATEYDSFRHFVDGEVVAMRSWPGWYDQLARDPAVEPAGAGAPASEPEEAGAAADAGEGSEVIEFGVAPLPSESVLGGQSLAVSSRSEHPEAAWDLIAHLTSADQQRRLFYCGGYPPVLEAAYTGPVAGECPEALTPENAPAAPTVESRRGEEYSRLLLAEVGNAHHRPTSPYYARYSSVLHTELNRLLRESEGELADADLAGLGSRLTEALQGR
ncbi:extracellular solute-binding protein [Streptomonospora sp. PA3]|uniref:extracellular solute-binding protein n=1 Tax=Streptomonospora sp. PA3 TaxID=2607326 RepID=UPI0012DD8ED6|nr:extracellular solute-binding protein [Streptomonospora sp. PA3]MUL41147.1 extracellular solute-binding protein [Streptomonospora sp. PA3]